jgi:hypothetical protein
MRIIGNDKDKARETQLVASGTLPNGKPVVVNSDGTVSAVAETNVTQNVGAATVITTNSTNWPTSAYDPVADRVVVFYRDNGNNNYGTAVVGTVSGTTISFGTPTVFKSSECNYNAATYDVASGKIVVVYEDSGNFSYGGAQVGTVSGSSISFGSRVTFNPNGTTRHLAITYDSTAQKVVVVYAWNTFFSASVGTVSGNSISFGSQAQIAQSGNQYRNCAVTYDPTADKIVAVGSDLGESTRPEAFLGTVSGTSISFGSEVPINFNTSSTSNAIAYDASIQAVVVVYKTASSTSRAEVGTISGSTLTFNNAVTNWDTTGGYNFNLVYDSYAQKCVVFYQNGTNYDPYVVTLTGSGTTLTAGTPVQIDNRNQDESTAVFDSGSNQVCLSWQNSQDTQQEAVMFRNAATAINLTAENYIGISKSGAPSGQGVTLSTQGGVSENQSSLTAGKSYYVQTDGTISTTAGDPSVFAGTAVSSTKLIVKG